MSTAVIPVSDMLVTVKTREIQRGYFAESSGDSAVAAKHYLAAGHLELVLLDDYASAGEDQLAVRSGLSAASCFWRAGDRDRAVETVEMLKESYPTFTDEIEQVIAELRQSGL